MDDGTRQFQIVLEGWWTLIVPLAWVGVVSVVLHVLLAVVKAIDWHRFRDKGSRQNEEPSLPPAGCGNCRYWNGLCRIHPPELARDAGDAEDPAGVWPATKPADWCSEHEYKDINSGDCVGYAPAIDELPEKWQ